MSRKPPRHITQKSASADGPAQSDRPDPVEKPQGAVPDASHFDGTDQASSDRSYAVGYGRPPLHSRFKPGQSGNPKGRPRQSRNLRTIVKKVCEQAMEIREGGRLRRMPTMEVLVRTLVSRGLKGDPKAVASLMVLGSSKWLRGRAGRNSSRSLGYPAIRGDRCRLPG
jgi:Family of unknown function (DUF5681)